LLGQFWGLHIDNARPYIRQSGSATGNITTLAKYVKMTVMDFRLILEKLLTAFKKHDIRYALMGGMALGA